MTGSRPLPTESVSPPAWRVMFALAVGLLLLSGGLASLLYLRFSLATDQVTHTYQVLDRIDGLVARVVDAEAGQRGYMITRDSRFLQSYEDVRKESGAIADELTTLVAGHPSQQMLAHQLQTAVHARLDSLARVMLAFEAGRTDDVGGGFDLGRDLMVQIRALAADMRAAEQAQLVERGNQVRLARRGAWMFAVLTLGLAVALAGVGLALEQTFRGREAALARHQEELRASEERFRTLADAMPQLAWTARADGHVDYFNRRWYEYTGVAASGDPGTVVDPDGTGLGWSWKDYLHSEDADATLDAWTRSLMTGADYEVQFRLRRKDGAWRWFMGRALPMREPSGAISRWVGTCTDIDDEKRADEERGQLLASERTARSEAERAARLKDEFVSTLSHELRTPLNAVVGWIGVLKQDPTPENIERGLDVIDRNLLRQTQMIDELLDMSRIISGKMRLEMEAVDLAQVVEEAVASASPTATAKGVLLSTAVEPCARIQGDPGRLQQVVWNLVTNAVKFTPRGGRVQVTLREEGGQAVLDVSDTGIGIEPHFLPHIFQRFRQADASVTREHGGLGLGLAIVKSLVEMHGGSVDAASEGRGAGSAFRVHLPLAQEVAGDGPSARPALPASPETHPALTGLRVLIVDDESDAREVAQWFLESAGADASGVGSVDEALALIDDGLIPDVIVSDIGLPGRDGFEFMKRVRQSAGPVARVPAAALTALARPEDRKRALLSGYQTHLPKPVDPTELVAVVASLAGRTGRPAA